jgi:hypothetical protein
VIHPWLNGTPYAMGCHHSWNIQAHFICNGANDLLFHDDTYEYHNIYQRVPVPELLQSVPMGRTGGVVRFGKHSNLLQLVKLLHVGNFKDKWDEEDEDEDKDIDISSNIIYGYASKDDYFSND